VRPSDPGWPTGAQWVQLGRDVEGRLLKPVSPFLNCDESGGNSECATGLQGLRNPYFIGDEPALTQASGWVDAWTCESSAYAVAAERTADVAAAVKEYAAGKVEFRNDTGGNVHSVVGKFSFPKEKLTDNINAMINQIRKMKPQTSKGQYFKKVVLKGTMTPAVYLAVN